MNQAREKPAILPHLLDDDLIAVLTINFRINHVLIYFVPMRSRQFDE